MATGNPLLIPSVAVAFGFVVGPLGVVSHLLGGVLTLIGIRPHSRSTMAITR